MRLSDHLRAVRHTFSANRARSALTLLGIMIGAGSIVLLAGLLRGGEEALLQSSQRASEADMVQVRRDEAPPKQARKPKRALTRRDEQALKQVSLLEGVTVSSENGRESRAFYQGRKKRVRLVAAGPDAPELYRIKVDQGRFLDASDVAERRRVCVVGYEVWKELLEEQRQLDGMSVVIEGHPWSVVGVLKNKPPIGGGGGNATWMWNRKVLVPHTVYDAMFAPNHEVYRIYVRLHGAGDLVSRIRAVEHLVNATLLRRHLGVQNFKVEGEEASQNQTRLILGVIKMLLLGTGLLSLFVGGINIMNIMLVTVTERTREIGVRRAIGAPPGTILGQFLLEAALIASVGGVAGVLGGMGLAWATARLLGRALGAWTLHIEPWSIVLGLSLSVTTGVVFGLFPAWRAARLDPVEALRYE